MTARAINVPPATREEQALLRAKDAVRRNPGEPEAHAQLAGSYNRSGRDDEALEELRAAARAETSDITAHILLAGMCEEKGLLEEAVAALTEIAELQPENNALAFLIAGDQERLGQAEAARVSYARSIDFLRLMVEQCEACAALRDLRPMEDEPDELTQALSGPLAMLGTALAKTGELREARDIMKRLEGLDQGEAAKLKQVIAQSA
jgi:tetratricopeptide (TPR) repeat protein